MLGFGGKLIFGFALAWLFVRWLAKSYVRRRASDQMLSIDVVMVIFVLLNFLLMAFLYGYIAGVCVLASFPAYKLCSRWGLAWLDDPPPMPAHERFCFCGCSASTAERSGCWKIWDSAGDISGQSG